MAKYTIYNGEKIEAQFEFDQSFNVIRVDKISAVNKYIGKELQVFDPRKTMFLNIKNPADIYEADLWASQVVQELGGDYSYVSVGVEWGSVLESEPNVLY